MNEKQDGKTAIVERANRELIFRRREERKGSEREIVYLGREKAIQRKLEKQVGSFASC